MAHRITRHRLDRIVARARENPPLRTAIVNPIDVMDVTAVFEAAELIHAMLLGPKAAIEDTAERAGIPLVDCTFIDIPDVLEAARLAVDLARSGEVDALMKGSLHTDDFMRVVMAEKALRTPRRMSHVAVIETPVLQRLVFVSDGAMNIAPTLEQKRDITQNAIDVARSAGVDLPKVAILAAVETVSSQMPATIDAAALAKMADRKQIVGAIVDGPLALDDAVSPEAARRKGIVSPVAGCADILIAPDIEAANILFKDIEYFAKGLCADVVVGASIPIVLTSRADDVFTRVASIALASLIKNRERVRP